MYAYLELNLFSALTSLENTGLIEIQSVILKVISLFEKEMLLIFRGIYNFPLAVA